MTLRIAIVNYGMGNLHSVVQAFSCVAPDAHVALVACADALRTADRIVLPGQGAMPDCVSALETSGLKEAVLEVARTKPLLGICVGQQLLFDHSEEGDTPGLGLFAGRSVRFDMQNQMQQDGSRFKVPHMGWNRVCHAAHALWQGIAQNSFYYFVHSFYVCPDDPNIVVGQTEYGVTFASAIARDNLFATQFHPEKSGSAGLQLCRNFVDWAP